MHSSPLRQGINNVKASSPQGYLRMYTGVTGLCGATQRVTTVVPLALPEAAAYPSQMKSDFWVATDSQFYICWLEYQFG
jgi:hypothetical protein